MATIESLDLATLTNNPQSIAQALEDVLQASNANIATLKQQIDADALTIANLKQQAETDAQTIANLTTSSAISFYTGSNAFSYTNQFSELNETNYDAVTYAYKIANIVHINLIGTTSYHTNHISRVEIGQLVPELRPIRNIIMFTSTGFQWSDQGDQHINAFIDTNGIIEAGNFSNMEHVSTMFGVNGFYYLD